MGRSRRGPPASPASKALDEAEQAQQRGERQSGAEALRHFEEAVARFRQALAYPDLPASKRPDALFGLGESLQQLAEQTVRQAEGLPDSLLTSQAEFQARELACRLYNESIQTYQQVTEQGRMRVDACVNCGNALTSLAELMEAPAATQGQAAQQQQQQQQQQCALYRQAVAMYDDALQQEEDALTHSNKGDALMQLSQALWDAGQVLEAQVTSQSALTSYETSCSLSSSSEGDDLPGLLANWGTGLITAGKYAAELAQRTALIDAAIARLQNCAEFARCDTAPLVSLGDALMAKAELNPSVKSVLTPEAGSMASSPSVPEILGAAALLQQALKDGYSAALHINKGTTEAQLGFAEAHAGLARLAASTGDLAAAAQYLQQAAAAYESVLRVPEEIGGFRERCDVRYNAMCVLALASRDAEACSILQQLIACGAVSTSDVAKDPDLAGRPWVQQLLLSSHDVCLEGEGMA
uniref:Uncharacterized protein n=1 Tax=Dunaliella tertiolecta TaxID=3047 RepID=A0A7S3VU66_DUNTE|mmetsp:Transcript_23583/g.64984  ORF Transcript_23583/g.64984 Transcript_23583/m.64984 type:complete len:469 (+) Transcript_23583:76-1482(+)